jgi:hypothetical protein
MASSVMGMLRSDVRLATPIRILAQPPAAAPYRASGLLPWHEPDQSGRSDEVRFSGKTGSALAEGQTGAFDPEQTFEQWHDAYFD